MLEIKFKQLLSRNFQNMPVIFQVTQIHFQMQSNDKKLSKKNFQRFLTNLI